MWGGTPRRNMVSSMTNLPVSWDVHTGRNIKWKAELGSSSYGNPVVADGKVFVGTNNSNPRNPEVKGDKGVLMCFREADGTFLWQAVTDKAVLRHQPGRTGRPGHGGVPRRQE
jgi:outer membrane protein assembly factor BamB